MCFSETANRLNKKEYWWKQALTEQYRRLNSPRSTSAKIHQCICGKGLRRDRRISRCQNYNENETQGLHTVDTFWNTYPPPPPTFLFGCVCPFSPFFLVGNYLIEFSGPVAVEGRRVPDTEKFLPFACMMSIRYNDWNFSNSSMIGL